MRDDAVVYDLGEVRLDSPETSGARRVKAIAARPARSRGALPAVPARRSSVSPALSGSLSLFLPGAGQLISGATATGFFFLTSMACAGVAFHAILVSRDRLLPTLDVLDVPRIAGAVTLGGLAFALAGLHLAAFEHAHALNDDGLGSPRHPVVAGLASALLPGWGQLLSGHRIRAALFVACLWIAAAAWTAVTPSGSALLRDLSVEIPRSVRDGWGPAALVSAPILVWAIAVYDAAMGARRDVRHLPDCWRR